MLDSAALPLTVYGSNLSYFTGKLEMYLRIKGIAYRFEPLNMRHIRPLVEQHTGTSQMPAVKLADGRWMSDTTPMIAWLEAQQPQPCLVPVDPLQRFFCLLLEDYADEWLWRPAMHFRWHSAEGAYLQSRHLVDELTPGIPLPRIAKRWLIRRRQRGGYTRGDGITAANQAQVESIYLNNLDWLSALLTHQPFMLGNSPSLADIAFMGPFFRHFSQDPVAAEIMKQRAPAVWEWVARLWNCTADDARADWVEGIPEHWAPWLEDIGRTYLPYLNANVQAIRAGKRRFDAQVDDVVYPAARASRYRIWCLEQLRAHYEALPQDAQAAARQLMQQHQCWAPLWEISPLDSGVNTGVELPFYCTDKMV
jgi:glutathione S-transferase